jgi:hypothetical protein
METKVATKDGGEAPLADHLWTVADMVTVLEEWESRQPHEKVGRKPKEKSK